jgi:hypothetical protein
MKSIITPPTSIIVPPTRDSIIVPPNSIIVPPTRTL